MTIRHDEPRFVDGESSPHWRTDSNRDTEGSPNFFHQSGKSGRLAPALRLVGGTAAKGRKQINPLRPAPTSPEFLLLQAHHVPESPDHELLSLLRDVGRVWRCVRKEIARLDAQSPSDRSHPLLGKATVT